MIAAAIILAILVVAGGIIYLTDGRKRRKASDVTETSNEAEGISEPSNAEASDGVCCGMHIVCEKDSLSTAAATEIVYYDDEELDIYANRPAESYTAEETEQFRDILLTLLPEDIAGWARSLQLRHIALPADVNDELLLIVTEARQAATKQ